MLVVQLYQLFPEDSAFVLEVEELFRLLIYLFFVLFDLAKSGLSLADLFLDLVELGLEFVFFLSGSFFGRIDM